MNASTSRLRELLPASDIVTAAVVVGTLYALEGSVRGALPAGAAVLALRLAGTAAEAVVGDYADNALLGVLILAFVGYLATTGAGPVVVVPGGLVGGWFLLDGIQHLRHGATREAVHAPLDRDRGAVSGLVGALVDRLVEPFRL